MQDGKVNELNARTQGPAATAVDQSHPLVDKRVPVDPRELEKSEVIFERLKQRTVYNWVSWLLVLLPLLELMQNLYQDFNPEPRPLRDCLVRSSAVTRNFTQVIVDGTVVSSGMESWFGTQRLLGDPTNHLLPTCVQLNSHDPSTLADFDNTDRAFLSFIGFLFFVVVLDILARLEFNARKAMFLLKHRVLVHNDPKMRRKELAQLAAIVLVIFLYILLKASILEKDKKVFASDSAGDIIWAISYDFGKSTLWTTVVGSLFFLSLLTVFYGKIDDIYKELKFSELVQFHGHVLLSSLSYISKTDMTTIANGVIRAHFEKDVTSFLWYLPWKQSFKCHLIDDSHPIVRYHLLPHIFATVTKINVDDLSKDCFYQDIDDAPSSAGHGSMEHSSSQQQQQV